MPPTSADAGGPSWAGAPRALGPSAWALPDPVEGSDDLVGFGADLAPETLVDAYRRGIFPWPHEGVALPWFSPDPRAVIPAGGAHVSRSLAARMRRCGWISTVDAAFDEVVAACAEGRADEGTWITPGMAAAYGRLQRLGWAHSLEVWAADGELVGGIYGVRVGGCFTGESMFHRRTDASKVALVDLCRRWEEAGGAFVDVQLPTDHLGTMGAVEVARARLLAMLAGVVDRTVSMQVDALPVSRLAG
ncbi:MAG: leucyl/phenylalanyl-tRNA--protein transferase [Acidimicrobiales bacterium]